MNRVVKCLLVVLMMIGLLPIVESNSVVIEAKENYDSYYPMACKAYEVDVVNDNGGFDSKGCYDDFDSAKNAMKSLGDDAVVRHVNSYSPTKIIAMNKGIAYSYPRRLSSTTNATLTILQNYSGSNSQYKKTTYMPCYRQIDYVDTKVYIPDEGVGMIVGYVTGFEGYIDLEATDLIPNKFIENNLSIYLGGNDLTSEHEAPYLTKVRRSYYTVQENDGYKELVFVAYSGWATDGNVPSKVFNAAVGLAADWMEVGKTYYSLNDYEFYTDIDMRNYAGTYYNYYEFLPLRSKSNISADTYNGFLSSKGKDSSSKLWNMGQVFIDCQNEYGMNAALVFAQACVESAYGTSYYAQSRNNLFGWNAVDTSPDSATKFSGIEQSIKEFMGIHLRNYLSTIDFRFFGQHYGNKGSGLTVKYASSIYYGLTISSVMYAFDKYAGMVDSNLYKVGNVNTYGAQVKQSANANSTTLYTTEYGSTYQENHTVIILGEEGDYYKIQSTNYIIDGQSLNTSYDTTLRNYDWNSNVGYILKSQVDIINNGKSNNTEEKKEESSILGTATVNVDQLRIRSGAGTNYSAQGYATNGTTYNVYKIEENGGYTWYAIDASLTKWIASTSDWVTYNAKKSETEEKKKEEKKEEKKEDPKKETTDDNKKSVEESKKLENNISIRDDWSAYQVLSSMTLSNDHMLTVSGLAFIDGRDATSGDSPTHQLVLVNLEDNSETVYECTTTTGDKFAFGDSHTYEKIYYTSTIDLDKLDGSNYALKIRVVYGNEGSEKYLFSNRVKALDSYEDGDKTVRVYPNSLYSNRFEISKEVDGINRSLINKPSSRFSARSVQNLSIQNGQLSFNGMGYIYNASFGSGDNPNYKVILVDESGNSYSFDGEASACAYDYTSLLNMKYTIANSCYKFNVDLTSLPKGNYRMYIDIKNNTYEDIEELYDYRKGKASESYNNVNYNISTSNVHSRFIVSIS